MAGEIPKKYVTNSTMLMECVESFRAEPILGFDTEFIGEQSFTPQLCLIQVSTPKALYVIDPLTINNLDPFWEVLGDESKTILVHSGREEARITRAATGKIPLHFYDLQIAAGLLGMQYPISLSSLCRETVRVTLEKSETLTDWAKRPLTPKQLAYAYDDVRYLISIHQQLEAKLVKFNRQSWLKEEWIRYCEKSVRDNRETERWRKLKGISGLNRRSLAIARDIYLWREDRAEKLNRPSRYLLRDDLIIELAKQQPQTIDHVASLRGINTRDAYTLLQIVENSRRIPDSELPEQEKKESEIGEFTWLTPLFSAMIGSICEAKEISPQLVFTQSDLKALLWSFSHQTERENTLLAQGWRREMLYDILESVWHGKRAMRLLQDDNGFYIQTLPVMPPAANPNLLPTQTTDTDAKPMEGINNG